MLSRHGRKVGGEVRVPPHHSHVEYGAPALALAEPARCRQFRGRECLAQAAAAVDCRAVNAIAAADPALERRKFSRAVTNRVALSPHGVTQALEKAPRQRLHHPKARASKTGNYPNGAPGVALLVGEMNRAKHGSVKSIPTASVDAVDCERLLRCIVPDWDITLFWLA